MNDLDLQRAVVEALAGGRVVRADEISVQVLDGNVFLRGTVGSLVQRVQAAGATAGVAGVRGVDNELRVRLMGVDGRADADTEAAVLDALAAAHLLDASDVDVEARDGSVTLRGNLRLESERDAVERLTRSVAGVARVVNQLDVWLVLSSDDVMVRIHEAILGLDRIGVRLRDNDVTLTGTVSSPEHRNAALAAAAGTPGVARVHDELTVGTAAA